MNLYKKTTYGAINIILHHESQIHVKQDRATHAQNRSKQLAISQRSTKDSLNTTSLYNVRS
ncbi:hypothetical protein BVRB_8g187850 [Beta vulgaris subsp. vulgaris]|nr:hypothetical protein BVRB_8g187850 [Beta vulgaris subsp. vulgaris]